MKTAKKNVNLKFQTIERKPKMDDSIIKVTDRSGKNIIFIGPRKEWNNGVR